MDVQQARTLTLKMSNFCDVTHLDSRKKRLSIHYQTLQMDCPAR